MKHEICPLHEQRDLFEIMRTNFSKFYNPSEHLAVDEVIVKFKGRVVFKQYILKKRKCFGIKMFKLCVSTGYTYTVRQLYNETEVIE